MADARATLDKAMSEAELWGAVKDYLLTFGWMFYHCRPAQNRGGKWITPLEGWAGFPDVVAVKDGRLLFIELKSQRGSLTEPQIQWLRVLDSAGGESHTPYGAKVYVWRPSDMSSGEVERVLGDSG